MEPMTIAMVRIELLETAVAALAKQTGTLATVTAAVEQRASDPRLAGLNANCFRLLDIMRKTATDPA